MTRFQWLFSKLGEKINRGVFDPMLIAALAISLVVTWVLKMME